MHRVGAVGTDVAGDLHHVVVRQALDGALVGHGEHHAARLALRDGPDEPQRHGGVAALVGQGEELFHRRRLPHLLPARAALHGEVGVLPLAVGGHVEVEGLLKVPGQLQLGKLLLQLPVDKIDHLATGVLRLLDHGQGLFPPVVEVEVLVEHALAA